MIQKLWFFTQLQSIGCINFADYRSEENVMDIDKGTPTVLGLQDMKARRAKAQLLGKFALTEAAR